MWCVRESYIGDDGSYGFGYRGVLHDKFSALQCAYSRRRALNSYWTVEVCELKITSAEVVEK